MKNANFKISLALLVTALAAPNIAWCQNGNGYVPESGTTPTIDTPGSPDGSYALSGFDTINYPNGRLNFALPLLKIPGRGQAKADAVLHIEPRWTVNSYTSYTCNQYACTPSQWSYAPNFITPYAEEPAMVGGVMLEKWAGNQCQVDSPSTSQWLQVITKPSWIQADGSEVEFRDEQVYGKPETGASGGSGTPQYRGTAFESFDANSYQFTASSGISDPTSCTGGATPIGLGGTVTTKDGLQYSFSPSYSYLGYPTLIEDRNGNQLAISYPNGNYLTQNITDPFNRVTKVELSAQGLQCVSGICAVTVDQVNYPGHVGSNPQTENINIYRTALGVQYTQQLGNKSRPMLRADDASAGIQTYTALFGGKGTTLCSVSVPCAGGNDPGGLPAEVLLPDGTAYEFYYDAYANLARVELPTGGAYEYDWNVYLASGGSSGNSPASYNIIPYITQKRVYSSSGTLVEKILFSGVFSGTTTAQYQDGKGTVIGSEVHTYIPPNTEPPNDATQYPGWQEGLEIHLQSENSAGAIIKDIGSTYDPRACPQNGAGECWFTSGSVQGCTNATDATCPSHDTQLTLEQTTYNGITAQNSYTYDVYNNRTSVAEYPYGNTTTPARTTNTSYLTGAGYLSAHILDLAQTETVYSGAASGTCGGTGDCVATTTWNYDESSRPPQACSGILGHDSHYGTSYTTRGNATSISRYANSSTTLTSFQTFDLGGNLVTSVDPRGVTKSYSFADTSQGAAPCTLPTTITSYTALNSTSGGYSDTFTYDYNIQKPLSHTDWNSQTTSYAYNDPLNRLTRVTRPDQAYTTYSYVDSAGNFSVTSNTDQTGIGDQKITRTTNYDGLGRKSQVSLFGSRGRAYRVLHLAKEI